MSENGVGATGSEEPIIVVDNRTIDPETGEVRHPSPVAGEVVEGEVVAEPIEVVETDVPGPEARRDDERKGSPGDIAAERTADLQRLTAEYANYRRRVERDRVTVIENAKASVITELLGVLDDLERARAHGDLESGPLKSVADKLSAALAKTGVTEFGAVGDVFDPTLHEAVQHEGDGHDPVIGTVMRKGYRMGERVLRHALVAVTDADALVTETPVSAAGAAPDDTDAGQ